MKRISAPQSRRNRARRQRKVKARHAKAGHWSPQARPLFTAGPVHYEIGAHPDVTPYGGIGVVHRLVTKLGLPKQIDQRLHLLKVHLPYHESDHVLNLAYNARICLRGDTDFSLTRHFDRWAQQVDFLFGMDCNATLRRHAEALEEACWQRLQRRSKEETRSELRRDRQRYQPREKERLVKEREFVNVQLNYEDVAEFDYQPRACQRPYRVVALRKNLSQMKGERTLFDEIRYFCYITTRTDLSAAEVVACANQRCDQENVIEQLKNGVHAMRVPLYDLVSNWAYMVMATLAWNLKSWMASVNPDFTTSRLQPPVSEAGHRATRLFQV